MRKTSLQQKIVMYQRSISSIISSPRFFPYANSRQSMIQATRWSLKVPLITWWRRSPDISSQMSARGNPSVKGYIYTISCGSHTQKVDSLTMTSAMIPQSVQRTRGSKCARSSSVCSRHQQRSSAGSPKSLRCLMHFGHHSWTTPVARVCSG